MMERPERPSPPSGHPDHWRAYKTLPIVDFFEDWKEEFRSLRWVALGHRDDDGVLLNHDRTTEVALSSSRVPKMQPADVCHRKFVISIATTVGPMRTAGKIVSKLWLSGT